MILRRKASPAFSTSTDHVAAALTETFRPATFRHAPRRDELRGRAGGHLDIAVLYPDLFPADPAPPLAYAVRAAVSLVSELAAAFRGAAVPKV